MKPIHNKKELLGNRKTLRNNSTAPEAILWLMLQKSQLQGRKFRRQHSVDNYILDFYCPQEQLAIELDGAHHYTLAGSENDTERDAHLASLNIKVLRFENRLIFENIEGVLEEIQSHFTNS